MVDYLTVKHTVLTLFWTFLSSGLLIISEIERKSLSLLTYLKIFLRHRLMEMKLWKFTKR